LLIRPKFLAFSLALSILFVAQATGQGISSIDDGANIGLPENGVFTGSDFDTIQTNNGYIHVRVPLLNVSGRGVSFPVEFVYDSSSFYETDKTITSKTGQQTTYVTWHLSAGVWQNGNNPWKLATPNSYVVWTHQNITSFRCGTQSQMTTFNGTIMIEPDGTTHHFVPDNLGMEEVTVSHRFRMACFTLTTAPVGCSAWIPTPATQTTAILLT